MSKTALYYTKKQNKRAVGVARRPEAEGGVLLPSPSGGQGNELKQLRKQLVKNTNRIRPRDIPKSSEERIYREILMDSLKPPSVKMKEAEEKQTAEAEKQVRKGAKEARRLRKEENLQDIANTVRIFPDMTRAQMEMLARFIEEVQREKRPASRAPPQREGESVIRPIPIARLPSQSEEEVFVTPPYFREDIETQRRERQLANRMERESVRKRQIEAEAKAREESQAQVQERMAAARAKREAAIAAIETRRKAKEEEELRTGAEARLLVPAEIPYMPPPGGAAEAAEEQAPEVRPAAEEMREGVDDLDVPLSDAELSTATSILQVASEKGKGRKPLSMNLNSLFGTPGAHLKTNLAKIRDFGPQKLQNRLNTAIKLREGQMSRDFEMAVERIIQQKQQKMDAARRR